MQSRFLLTGVLFYLLADGVAIADQFVIDDIKTVNSYFEAERTIGQTNIILGISKLANLYTSSEYQKSIRPLISERLKSIKNNLPHFFWSLESQGTQRRYKTDEIMLEVNGERLPFRVSRKSGSQPIGSIKYGTNLYSGLDRDNRNVTQFQLQHSLTAYDDKRIKNSYSLAWDAPVMKMESITGLRFGVDMSNFSDRSPKRVGLEWKTFFEPQKSLTFDFYTGTNYEAIVSLAEEQRFSQWTIGYTQPIADTYVSLEQKWYEIRKLHLEFSQLGAKFSLPRKTDGIELTFDLSVRNYRGIQYPHAKSRFDKKAGFVISKRLLSSSKAKLFARVERNYSNIDIFTYETFDFGIQIQN